MDSFEDIIDKLREWILGEEGDLTILRDFNIPEMDRWGEIQIENLYKKASQKELNKKTGSRRCPPPNGWSFVRNKVCFN